MTQCHTTTVRRADAMLGTFRYSVGDYILRLILPDSPAPSLGEAPDQKVNG